MRYTLSNTINKPLETVIAKFTDPEGVKHWMDGLQRIEHVSGKPHEVGARTDFHFRHRNREMKIEETILEQDLPRRIKFGYRSPMGYNEVEIVFDKNADGTVRQTSNNFFVLTGFKKIMGLLMKGMFKKQSMKYMDAFKRYAEQ